MKTGFITTGLLLLLVCLPVSVPASKANIVTNEGTTAAYQPYIISPSNMGYYSNVLTLNVSFRSEVWGNVKYTMVYSLDGQENKSFPLTDHYFSWVQGEHDKCYDDGSVTLPELAKGLHNVTVYLQCDWAIGYQTGFVDNYYNDSQTVIFTMMDNTTPFSSPVASASFAGPLGNFGITSPSNITYNSSMLNLNVTGQVIVGSNVKLLMNYSLDRQECIPLPLQTYQAHPGDPLIGAINASVILPELSEGSHNVTVFGDLEALGPHLAQATVFFTINTQPSENSAPSPTPAINQEISISPSPSPSPTPELTLSTKQQLAIEPTQTAGPSQIIDHFPNYVLMLQIGIVTVLTVAILGALVYLRRIKKQK